MPAVCFNPFIMLDAWPAIFVADLLRYVIPTSFVALVISLLPPDWAALRRVRLRQPEAGQQGRELSFSLLTVLIFSMNGVVIFAGAKLGWLQIYTAVDDRGWMYLLASLAGLVVLHDAWFYWTHRLMHRPRWFRWIHGVHHRSVAPTPWAAYSFAPAEAVIHAVFLTLVLAVLPLHPLAIFVFLVHMIARNVLGHAGIELVPGRWLAGWWGRWMTTTLHHDLHHAHGRYNFGLYFTWWDRIGGTEHPDYRGRLREVVHQIAQASFTAAAGQPRGRGNSK